MLIYIWIQVISGTVFHALSKSYDWLSYIMSYGCPSLPVQISNTKVCHDSSVWCGVCGTGDGRVDHKAVRCWGSPLRERCGDWAVRAAPHTGRRATTEQLHKRVQGVHGVNGRRGPGALVALSSVPAAALSAILADKRAVLVELAVSSFPVVN